MWKRNSKDPLASLLHDRYRLHLLRQPREDVSVGHVYPGHNKRVLNPGRLEHLIEPAPELPAIRKGEHLADVVATTSDAVATEAGLGFLESFLSALGAVGITAKLGASVGAKHAKGMRFRFARAVRDYVDPFEMERQLRKHKFDLDDSLIKEGYRYYLVVGVIRSNAIGFTAVDQHSYALNLDVKAAELANVDAGIELERASSEEITVTGKRRLTFGVQLSEMVYNADKSRLELAPLKDLLPVRVVRVDTPVYSMIGGAEEDMFLPLE